MIQIKFTLRMKQGMHSKECDSASHCIPSADISTKMMIRSNSPDLQKGGGKHILCVIFNVGIISFLIKQAPGY